MERSGALPRNQSNTCLHRRLLDGVLEEPSGRAHDGEGFKNDRIVSDRPQAVRPMGEAGARGLDHSSRAAACPPPDTAEPKGDPHDLLA